MAAIFEQNFFVELYKLAKIYGDIYITEDGNMFRTEKQARDRCASRNKIAHLNDSEVAPMRYAHITITNWKFPPRDVIKCRHLMEQLFEMQEMRRRRQERESMKEPVVDILTDKEAMREMERMAETPTTEDAADAPDMIHIGDTLYPLEKVRDAIKQTVEPSLHPRTGLTKVQALIDELAPEQTDLIVNALQTN